MSGGALERDARWMRQAVLMAQRGLGTTAPNPSVGAVLVRYDLHPDGVLVARAVTQPGGRPHAETVALAAAGAAARGATLYVTLEPCSHHGKTPPCAESVIAAGVARVVLGIEDPDPRVAGRGIAMLRAAGVEVDIGVEAKACAWVTLGHILRVTERRPAVLIKMALATDLTVPAALNGRPNFVTGAEARAFGHLLRAQSDAILIGSGTVRADDPELTCRLPGMERRSPRRIVLDGMLDAIAPNSKLIISARTTPVFVATSSASTPDKRKTLADLGVRVCIVDATGHRPNLMAVLNQLADSGVTRLLVEGGPKMWQSFAGVGSIDEAVIFVQGNPATISPAPTFGDLSGLQTDLPMILTGRGVIGDDSYFEFRRERL